jgi:glycosyltransferase involved in cell wall biosynthesis
MAEVMPIPSQPLDTFPRPGESTSPTSLSDVSSYKVSIVVGDLSSKGAGRWGGAVRPFLLAQALQKLGMAIEVLGFSDESESTFPDATCPIRIFPYAPYPQFLGSVRHLMQSVRGDIIYAYKTKASSFGMGLLARQLRRRPLILDIDDWEMSWHGGDTWCYQPGSWKQRYRDWVKPDGAFRQPDHPVYLQQMEQRTHQANAVTVHTQFLQERFHGVYIPNGKDTDHFNPAKYDSRVSRQRYGLVGYRILMFPGAPRPYKGLEDILTALDLINEPDLKLVIVGGSPYDNYDESLMSRWGRHIVKLPKQPHGQMPEVVAAADVIVVPQQNTPAAQAQFPLKLTDGMAMAKPILATRVGDIPTILGETGYLVPPGDSAAMAASIQDIFADLAAAQYKGSLARQRCIDHYSLQAMGRGLHQVIAPLLL